MKNKRIISLIILFGYIFSYLLSSLGYVNRNTAVAASENKKTDIVAVLVEDSLYNNIETDLKRYATNYIQKEYPQSKALVLKINTKEYSAPEITKLLENIYFDGIEEESSQLIGVVLVGEIPLPVVKYDEYIFPSIYPYVDFLEQKYIWDEDSAYFLKNKDGGEAELWHGIINFKNNTAAYHDFFGKLKTYKADPTAFVDKKIWYDDFIALKENFLEDVYRLYQNKIIFAEDLMYHRYTNFFTRILEGELESENKEVFKDLSSDLKELGTSLPDLDTSIEQLGKNKGEYTPTKLLQKKILSFLKDYHETISTPLLNTISENVKASDRRELSESHYQKIQLKDQLLLGNTETNGIIKSINDELELFVDKKIEEEKYAMNTVIPVSYQISQDEKRKVLVKNYYIPKINDLYQFFYFGKYAGTISKAEDFSIFRGSYRNLSGFVNYSTIINDPSNPAKIKEEKTDLTKKGIGASYDIFSTQVEANRAFNVLNTETEYNLYQEEKTYKDFERKCEKKRLNLPRWVPFIPCRKRKIQGKGKCDPKSDNPKKRADCEDFSDFGNRVWGGATPLNIDYEKFQNQIYSFSGDYDGQLALKTIFDIAGSVPAKKNENDAQHYVGQKTYSSPMHIKNVEGILPLPYYNTGLIEKVRYFNVPLNDKEFITESNSSFKLTKKKKNKTDEELIYKYKIIDSKIKHDASTPVQVNGYSGLKYSENSESRGYYTMIKESFSLPEDTSSAPLLQNLEALKNQLTLLKNNFQSARSSNNSTTIGSLLPPQTLQTIHMLSSGQVERWNIFNSLISRNYAGNIGDTIEGILQRQIKQNEKIGLYQERYTAILQEFSTLQTFLNTKQQVGNQIFDTYHQISKTTSELKTMIDQEIASHPGTGINESIRNAWQSLYQPFSSLNTSVQNINQAEVCNANHSTLGYLLGKVKSEINYGDEQLPSCSGESNENNNEDGGESPFQAMITNLREVKTTFNSKFLSDSTNPVVHIEGLNMLTPERPIDSPRYISFQGIGENLVKLTYPNLFKVEVYKGSNLLELKKNGEKRAENEVREALVQYLKNKVEEYNLILETEKNKAQQLNNDHYKKLLIVDKFATPSLESRPYKPFTYEEIVEAIGGEKMLNTLSELLYYQSISNKAKASFDDIEKDIEDTRETFDINEKIGYVVKNYLSQENDKHYEEDKKSFSKLVIPSYSATGYEVGYINSEDDDSIINQGQLFDDLSNRLIAEETAFPELTPFDAKEAEDIQKECGFDINEGLLLYNFETKNFDRRDGLKCRLEEVKKKPFEIKISFEGSLGSAPLKETIKGDIIAPLKDSRESYKQEFKPSIAFHELAPFDTKNEDQIVQEILNQTQITTENKKINVINKTGAFNFLSLKDYGNLTVKVSSTGDNCLIINGIDTCATKAIITKSPFKEGFETPFTLGKNTIGIVVATLELCSAGGNCATKPISLSVVPGPVKSFEIGLPKDKRILAGAYTLVELKAHDVYKNEIARTLEPYTIEVDKGNLIIGGLSKKSQEVNDFQNLTLLYKSDQKDSGIVKFSIKNKKGELLGSNSATIIQGKLSLEYNEKRPLKDVDYELSKESYFSSDSAGNMQLNLEKAVPVDLVLRDNNDQILPMITNIVLGAKKGLAQIMTLKETKDNENKTKLTLTPTSSLFIEGGKTRVYLIPGYKAGKEKIDFVIPGLPEESINLTINPGSLAQLTFDLEKEKMDPNSQAKAKVILTDNRGNQLRDKTKITIESIGSIKVEPRGTMLVSSGEQSLTLKSDTKGGLTKLLAEAQSENKLKQGSANVITRKFFLEPAINSGLNVMYLNLFGNDRGNQRGYQSSNNKLGEKIIEKSDKTLAITTQLVDLAKIKKTSLIFGKDAKIVNNDNLEIKAYQEKDKFSMNIQNIGQIQIGDSFSKIKVILNDPNNKTLEELLEKEKEKTIFLYDLNSDFIYNKGVFTNKEGAVFGNLGQEIFFERTNEFQSGRTIWNIKGKNQILGKALLTNSDFSKSTANIENKEYEFGEIFTNGSSNQYAKAIFSTLQTLESTYQGYDSIQNSDEMEKYIGFRGDFKNITSFAGGKTVGEATLPFGSEFLINLGDPLLKRIDKNQNIEKADYNKGLGKVVYSDPERPIFKTLDIDYNNDGLRDLIVVYKDGTIKLQKQYQDKEFKDMGTLMLTAEQIQEVFVGDVDGNKYEDIIIRNTSNELRIYTNQNGVFDVDGNVACLNTNTKLNETTKTPEDLSGIYQLFVKDLDNDGKIDISTLDKQGYLKIFYGEGSLKNHSYLSKEVYDCDDERYKRQKDTTKIVKKFGLQLNGQAIRDESLIRRDGLNYPTEGEIEQALAEKNNREKGIETDPILLGKIENPELKAPLQVVDYSCERNEYGEQFCKKFWRYNSCKGAPNPGQPFPKCNEEYREMDRKNDDQRIRGKATYEDGMCRLPAVASCVLDGKDKNGRIDDKSKAEIIGANSSFDFVDTAQAGVGVFDKYVKNPFLDIPGFEKGENRAFIPINKLETPSLKLLGDKLRDVSKRYTDVNGGNLENGDIVKVQVLIINKYGKFTENGAFFDKITGPREIQQDKNTGAPKNLTFHEGSATINPQTKEYAYFLTGLTFSLKSTIVYSYDLVYNMEKALFNISLDDVEIEDYLKSAPKEGENADGLLDFVIQPIDGCNKQQSVLFNNKTNKNRGYRESVIDLQALADNYAAEINKNQQQAEGNAKDGIQNTQSTETLNAMPGLDTIQESFSDKGFLEQLFGVDKKEFGSFILNGGLSDTNSININFFDKELENIQKGVQEVADGMCNGFSFGLKNLKACEGLPVPFNQAFLAPGKYHLMGCIPIEPLTRTLGKGLPVFHFPGTLWTPTGAPIPIPWGLKSPSDGFLRMGGGSPTYPSMIRIYAAPTLTAQLGLAICVGPYNGGINMPSPLSDIAGNCIVTSMPLPCGKNGNGGADENNEAETYNSWAGNYGKTNTCQLQKSDSPFKIVASPTINNNFPANGAEESYLGGVINIDYDSITSSADGEQNGLFIDGVKIQGVKDLKNKILGGKQQGIQAKLVGWFDRQTQYRINNLLRFRVEFIFPDMEYLSKQISSFNFKEIGKLVGEGKEKERENIENIYKKIKAVPESVIENPANLLISKEQLTSLDLANGENPFEKLQTFFNSKELVNISTQKLNVRIPWIYSEDIEAYIGYLNTWGETNGAVLDDWEKMIELSIFSCQKEISTLVGEEQEKKKRECKSIQDAKTQILQMQSKFDKTSEQIFQNIQTLELYKRFPLEIYEWLHVSDKYLGEISALLSNFFGYINYWMEVNANRFSQYVDAIITILAVVKTYQVMVDLFVDRGKKCGKCTNDSYDQYSCKLSMLCPDIPIIGIPSVKIPSLYIDLSHLNLGMDIVLPRFNFVPESIELPRLANFPEPPQLGINFNIDFNIPDIPQLPEPPNLPELPSFIPQVKMQLPILPPAPKIPELPNEISTIISVAKNLSKIYCIVKSGIGLVGENSVKARIEQMTQRSYEVPRVDNLDLSRLFKKTPLQGIDIQVDTYVNLQYNFDAFYSLLKGITDNINQTTYHLTSQVQEGSDKISNLNDETTNILNDLTDDPVNLNLNLGYQANLKSQLTNLQESLTTEQEKEKLTPILALASTNTKIKKNESGITNIQTQINNLVKNERTDLSKLANLAKTDYTAFLKSLEKDQKTEPLQLSFSTSLLDKNDAAQKTIEGQNPIEELIKTESKRMNGYMLALESHSASELNMSQDSYDKSKNYLEAIKKELNQRNSIKTQKYAGTQTLIAKNNNSIAEKTLLAQTSNGKPATINGATTDLSAYVNGVLVKNHEKNLVNVVHSKVNYEQFPSYYQQDLNNDKKTEVITRDSNNVYIKYANDVESTLSQEYKNYNVITPQLKNKEKKYENLGGSWLSKKDKIKLYDENREVKNFNIGGQTFDSLTFYRDHNKTENIDGYLVRSSERVDGLLEKNDLENVKYLLFLPIGTEIKDIKLQVGGSAFKAENQIGKMIYEIQYYNPANDVLQFNLHKVPRKWQYLQITSLSNEENLYTQNAPRSNQIVGGRQVVGDEEPPKPKIELIRNRKPLTVDQGLDLEGFIGSYYDIQITRTDNAKVRIAKIEQDGKILAEKDINAPKGSIILKDLFFTKEQTIYYIISAYDCKGNETIEEISLTINIPGIQIENIERYSGWKEGIENPVLISSTLETDIDKGDVSFERKRSEKITTLTAINNGKKEQIYPVSTYQTSITGAYYDFGELIGLYTKNNELIATVNGENGEILIQPKYKKTHSLGVDFSKGYPVVKVLEGSNQTFEIILKAEEIINKEVLKGRILPIEGDNYGLFNGGEVLMVGKDPMLYIAPNGNLRTNKPLQGTYTFNTTNKTVTYSISEHGFGDPLLQITIKTQAI